MNEKWVSVRDACQALEISESTLYRRLESGKLEAKMEDGRRLIRLPRDSQVTDDVIRELRGDKDRLIAQVERLERELSQSRERQDTIILTLTQQVRVLKDRRPWWSRIFKKKREPV